MPYKEPPSVADFDEALDYNPKTGKFTWKIRAAKNVPAGAEAGCVKASRVAANGQVTSYRYIRFLNMELPAARVAWFMHYCEWPEGKITFKDGDTLNLRIENLEMTNSVPQKFDHNDADDRAAYMKAHRARHPLAWKESALQRDFGLSLQDYVAMATAQESKCAICGEPETQMRAGKVKSLSVDHDHATGKIRGLLCVACNQAIGKFKEDRNVLLAAIKYLDKHAGIEAAKPNLTVIERSD